jgi:hypothetical protein
MAVAVEKLLRARTSRNQIAPGCHINDLLEFRDISGHPISPEEATKKSFSTATDVIANIPLLRPQGHRFRESRPQMSRFFNNILSCSWETWCYWCERPWVLKNSVQQG